MLCDADWCALPCELPNTEQLLSFLGMYAYECGSLKKCNAVLSEYCPESMILIGTTFKWCEMEEIK